MKRTKYIVTFVALAAFVVCAASAQKVTIDMRYNIAASEPAKDYFTWSLGNKKVNKDQFDVASGASKLKSTQEFDLVRYDAPATKKATIPVALRGLLGYPVSNRETATADNLTVTQEADKSLTIRYVHRDTAYQLKTDAQGKLDVTTSASMAAGIADNVAGTFVLKADYLKAGGNPNKMADLDWSKISLVADKAAADASRSYVGTLDTEYKNGILTVKGTLNQK